MPEKHREQPEEIPEEENIIGGHFSDDAEDGLPIKPPSKKNTPPSLSKAFELAAPEDVDAKEWGEAVVRGKEILSFLRRLKGRISARVYNDYFNNIQNFSDEDLAKTALNFGEKEWQADPAYYKALAEEIIIRASYPEKHKEIKVLKDKKLKIFKPEE